MNRNIDIVVVITFIYVLGLISGGLAIYVLYFSDPNFDRVDGVEVLGNYDQAKNEIKLYLDTMWETEYIETAVHEFGHPIFRHYLTPSQKYAYFKIYKNSSEFVSDYAQDCSKTSRRCIKHEEDFAESLAYAVQCYYNSSVLTPERNEFMLKYKVPTVLGLEVRG